jgi:3-phenylpropionate/trans-cinnamate dioxygenase ferredoxin subunit
MPLKDLEPKGMAEIVIGRQLVLLIQHDDQLHAVQGLCPHAFTRLVTGRVTDDGWLACPAHAAMFNLADGRCGRGWILPALRRYPTRLVDGMVLLPDPLQHID